MRQKKKSLIKFKSLPDVQKLLSLMSKVHNIFVVDVGRYKKKAPDQRLAFAAVQAIWLEAG